jgi:hypothetical protein
MLLRAAWLLTFLDAAEGAGLDALAAADALVRIDDGRAILGLAEGRAANLDAGPALAAVGDMRLRVWVERSIRRQGDLNTSTESLSSCFTAVLSAFLMLVASWASMVSTSSAPMARQSASMSRYFPFGTESGETPSACSLSVMPLHGFPCAPVMAVVLLSRMQSVPLPPL